MKKTVLLLFTALAMMATAVVAQVVKPEPTGYGDIFTTFAALVVGIPFITEGLKSILSIAGGWAAQAVSWLTGIALGGFGYWFNLGLFEALEIWQALAVGFGASLAANGVFDSGIVEWILKLLGLLKPAAR